MKLILDYVFQLPETVEELGFAEIDILIGMFNNSSPEIVRESRLFRKKRTRQVERHNDAVSIRRHVETGFCPSIVYAQKELSLCVVQLAGYTFD